MPEIKNTFLKGRMNQDLDSRIIPNGEYREAINLLISRSEGATVGEFENILGNTVASNISQTKELFVIGHYVDETSNTAYVYVTDFSNDDPDVRADSSRTCQIQEINLDNPLNPTILVDGFFLNFNKKFPIYGVNKLEELLFWTDNLNQPRRINITTARNNSSAYTTEDNISVAKYYPWNPIIPLSRQTVTTAAGGTTTQIIIASGNDNIRVGDYVMDNDKTGPLSATKPLIGNSLPPVRVTEVVNNTTFNVSPAITIGTTTTPTALPAGVKIDFSRTTMENQSDANLSNYSTQLVGTVKAQGSTLTVGVGALTSSITQNTTDGNTGGSPYTVTVGATAGVSTSGSGANAVLVITLINNPFTGEDYVSAIEVTNGGYGFAATDTITVDTTVIGGTTDLIITLQAGDVGSTNNIWIEPAVLGGLPKIGDIVTCTSTPDNLPNPSNSVASARYNLRVDSLEVTSVAANDGGKWAFSVDKDPTATSGGTPIPGFVAGETIAFATNPLYKAGFTGDSKFLEDKFVRFSYRFKFNDNEYSLMAPFSQIMFVPKQYGEFGSGQLNAEIDDIYNYYQDEVNAYTSTILQWFENDIDTIALKIPVPVSSVAELASAYNIKKIDILYKESDSQAVKVLDTIDADTIASLQSVEYDDLLNGLKTQYFYEYNYESSKPYKVLPENQTTRVYDKVPIKALAQEIITNRIVYGNYTEKMTPPNSIDYSAGFTNRDIQATDYAIEYPYSNVKQNRTYQVGFVLVDKYGRQSDVILSSNDNISDTSGSSVYVPYSSASDVANTPVIDWLGSNLTLTINEAIGAVSNSSTGEPGLYREDGFVDTISSITEAGGGYSVDTNYPTAPSSGSGAGSGCVVRVTSVSGTGGVLGLTIMNAGSGYSDGDVLELPDTGKICKFSITVGEANPLGWYSYKIVVKQQEQEYYNVFLPGLVNGLPVQNKLWDGVAGAGASTSSIENEIQRGKIAFSSLLSDNINKIPRNLTEVGPTDNEYNSDEILYFRVNNPNTTDTLGVRNLQYYPGQISQNVLTISPNSEAKLASVPFVAFNAGSDSSLFDTTDTSAEFVQDGSPTTGNKGEWGSTVRFTPSGSSATNPIVRNTPSGSIPWGDVADKESFYGADQNPFMIKIGQTNNPNNPLGAIVCGANFAGAVHDTNYASGVRSMQPILSVAETKPVFSLLPIFWETTSSGKLEQLNSAINTTDNGAVGLTVANISFPESDNTNTTLSPTFKCINGSGAEMTNVDSISITKVYRQNDVGQVNVNPGYFTIYDAGDNTNFGIKTAKKYWYSLASNSIPSEDVYIFDLRITSNTGADIRDLTGVLTVSLTNVDPKIFSDAAFTDDITSGTKNLSNIAVDATTITQLYGQNGGADDSGTPKNYTRELVWEITGIIPSKLGSLSDFSISSDGIITTNQLMVNEGAYGLMIKVTDVDNTGSNKRSVSCNITWTAGTLYAPKIIGKGNTLTGSPGSMASTNRGEYRFTNDNYSLSTVSSGGYPVGWSAASFVYNAQTEYNADFGTSCQANLFQGTIIIKPTITNAVASAGDMNILYSVQYRTVGPAPAFTRGPWTSINSSADSVDTWTAGDTYKQLTKSTSIINNTEFDSYEFDQLGEYRVVTNVLNDTSGAASVTFYVDYQDGAYGLTALGPCNS